ncbi:MAG: FHA domain-containing protein [Paludibacteraceae bacterium]|nr:FHA domain-containing protein [Paludibacteraceae bacterium]MBQ2189802.1 FHA domain-containing protein [Paludibacteraceae bacterium]
MAQATQAYKRSLSGSVGAGLSSVFNGSGRTYYILEHKVSSKYHKAGEAQEIIVDQIELGRDSKCQVQFDESFQTVSRRHAAIVRDGDNWKLIQLSQTNTTFLNGHPVQKEWYLQNGDEIQLSVNGPKLGFIIPTGNKAKTGSIGLSRRLSLFREQALRPYKAAMAVMGAVIALLIAGGVTYGVLDHLSDVKREKMTAAQIEQMQHEADSIQAAHEAESAAMMEEIQNVKKDNAALKRRIKDIQAPPAAVPAEGTTPRVTGSTTSNKTIAACEPQVYFVKISKIVLSYEGDSRTYENIGTGSGFLLDDGRFITARHVVEPWMYPSSEEDEFSLICNAIVHGGGDAVCYIDAYSPTGQHIAFTSKQVVVDRSSDKVYSYSGDEIRIPEDDDLDWAYYRTSLSGGLPYNNTLSTKLPVQAKLTVLGYPFGLGANSSSDIHPIYSEAVVAREGLVNKCILTTATTFEHGNSGGPVFATSTNDDLIVVGLVSAGRGRSTGIVVPIAAVK